jgi:hypothetical protein
LEFGPEVELQRPNTLLIEKIVHFWVMELEFVWILGDGIWILKP